MSAPLHPAEIEGMILDVLERLERGQMVIADLEADFSAKSVAYDLAFARATLNAEGSNAEARKARAVLACELELRDKEVSVLALKSARGRMDVLRTKADLLRTLSASVRTSMSVT